MMFGKMNRFSKYLLTGAVLLVLMLNCSCTEESPFNVEQEKYGNVTLVLPGVLTRATGDDSESHSDADIPLEISGQNEGSIDTGKGLWFFAFPTEEGKGEAVIRRIDPDLTDGENQHKRFYILLKYGSYDFYMAANIDDMESVKSADELKSKILAYTTNLTTELRPGHLPMYREALRVEVADGTQTTVDMHLLFLCSKVSLQFTAAKPDSQFTVSNIVLHQAASESVVDEEQCKAHSFTEFLNDIRLKETLNVPGTTAETNEKCIFYVPEYYPKGENATSHLTMTVSQGEGTGKSYRLNLGGKPAENVTNTTFEGGDLVRGTFYDMYVTLADQTEEWKLTVNNFTWTTETLEAGFPETTLRVSDTQSLMVLPFVTGEFSYESNAQTVEISCETKIGDTPVLILTEGERYESGIVPVDIKLNPVLSVDDFKNWGGQKTETDPENGETYYTATATLRLKANNLIKEIDVELRVYELFEVTPPSVTLTEVGEGNGQTFTYRTNMKNVTINHPGDCPYRYSAPTPKEDGSYEIKVWTDNIGQRSSTPFTITATDSNGKPRTATLYVNILPKDVYMVHFTSINSCLLEESCHELAYNDGENDYFEPNKNVDRRYPQTYVSTKDWIAAGSEKYESNGREVHGKKCYAFTTQPELYYVDMIVNGNSTKKFNDADNKTTREGIWMNYELSGNEIKPGETELKFSGKRYPHNNDKEKEWNGAVKYSFHHNLDDTRVGVEDTPMRYPYGASPMKLFSYVTREGWVVADPTVLSTHWLSTRPEIVTVKYVIDVANCPEQAYGLRWYLSYGQIFEGDKKAGQFLIQSEPGTNKAFKAIKAHAMGNQCYRFVFELESIKRNTGKDIKISIRTQYGTLECGTLFNGGDYNTGKVDGEGNIIAAGTYDVTTGTWKEGVTGDLNAIGTEITDNMTLPDLDVPDKFRIYFYKPLEPAAWIPDDGIKMNMGAKGDGRCWNDKYPMHQYNQEKSTKLWFYSIPNTQHPGGDNPYAVAEKENAEMVAIFSNKYKNNTDNQSSDKDGYVYKADCWSWAATYNSYFPDFRIKNTNVPNHGLVIGQDNKAVYYMDRKAFLHRPR